MTRGLWCAAWIFGAVAWVGLLLGWRDVLVVAALVSAGAWLAWGYRVHPTESEGAGMHDWETTEWRCAVNAMTEWDRTDNPHDYDGLGMTGDKEDARNE